MHRPSSTATLGLSLIIAMGALLSSHDVLGAASQDGADKGSIRSSKSGTKSECGAEVRGCAAIFRPGVLTIFGELHGTNEAPAFIGNMACRAAQFGLAVRVGLEIPASLQPKVNVFLASKGSRNDVELLTTGQFWLSDDGRSSKAMLALFDKIRQLKQSDQDVDVYLFDVSAMNMADRDKRDKRMAENILSALTMSPQAVHFVLTGNLHARTNQKRYMGWQIIQRHKQTTSLNIGYRSGSAWICTSDGCGESKLGGNDRGDNQFVEILDRRNRNGYHGVFYVGDVTASPPVRDVGEK